MLFVAKVGIFKAKCDKNQPQTKQGLALSKRRYSRSSFQTEWRTPRRLWVKALVKNPILGTLTRNFHCRFALISSFQDKTLTIFALFRQICCIFVKRLLCYHYKSPLYHHLENVWLSQNGICLSKFAVMGDFVVLSFYQKAKNPYFDFMDTSLRSV